MKKYIQLNYLMIMFAFSVMQPTAYAYTGETTRIDISSTFPNEDYYYIEPTFLSADGRFVFLNRVYTTLLGEQLQDDFVNDRLTGKTTRIDLPSTVLANFSNVKAISANGRYLAFAWDTDNLVPGDTNGYSDGFIRDLLTGKTTRLTVSSAGIQGNKDSYPTAMSADSRYVAFDSAADNLVTGDTNGHSDAFIHDRVTGKTIRVSVSSTEEEGNNDSHSTAISADGRYVVFESYADNLVFNDTNRNNDNWGVDIFIHDCVTGRTSRVSVSSAGGQANGDSRSGAISADGRYVAFFSTADNLVTGDTNADRSSEDIFLHDRLTGKTSRMNVSSTGEQANDYSGDNLTISADGRYVAFDSLATNLVDGDTNGFPPYNYCPDVFVHDRVTGNTSRVSVNSLGEQGNDYSGGGLISADGRYVTFWSSARNLVDGVTKGLTDVFIRDRLLDNSRAADLQLTVTAKPMSTIKGQNAIYKLKVTNKGPNSADKVSLTHIVINGTILGINRSQGSCSKAAISVCRLGKLKPGASALLIFKIKANASSLTQKISVNAAPKDKVPGNNFINLSTLVTH